MPVSFVEHLNKALCVQAILQYPNTEISYTLFTDAGHFVDSGVIIHVVDNPDDLRPIVYTLGLFSDKQQ